MIEDVHPGSGSRIRILDFLPIPDPGSKGPGTRIRNTVSEYRSCFLSVTHSGAHENVRHNGYTWMSHKDLQIDSPPARLATLPQADARYSTEVLTSRY